jgi:O-antigen/teichoic acid export membrane protein
MPASPGSSPKSNPRADDPLLGPFLRGGAGNLAIQLALIANNSVVSVALARGMSPAGYGTYTLAFNIVMVLATLAQLGLPTLIVWETARADADGAAGRAKGIARFALAATTALVAVISAAAGVALLGNLAGASAVLRTTLAVGLAAAPAVVVAGWAGAVLRGHRRVVLGRAPHLRMVASGAGVLVLAGGGVGTWLTPVGIMTVHGVAAWMAAGATLGLLLATRPAGGGTQPARYDPRGWTAALGPLTATALLTMINARADALVLGALASDAALGQYRAAWQAAMIAGLDTTVVQLVIAPYIARFHALGDHARVQRSLTLAARAVLGVAVPVALALTLSGASLLAAVFGPAYALAAPVAALLAAGRPSTAAFAGATTALDMTGHAEATVRATAVAAGINVAGNLLLIPLAGAIGAAVATSVSLGIWNLTLAAAARRRCALNVSAL